MTLHDKTNEPVVDILDVHHPHHKVLDQNPVFPKPILKKSSDDIYFARSGLNEAATAGRPILKRKDSENSLVVPTSGSGPAVTSGGSSTSAVSSSITVGSSSEVKSSLKSSLKRKSVTTDENSLHSTTSKPDHVRIRSPSPDLELRPSGILRSRNSSLGEEEFPQSILKRRNSQDDLDGDVSASAGNVNLYIPCHVI